jgi:GNAT superfamily N-acetyltransferase
LFYEYALPDDPELDRFDSGEDEVNAYFRSRRWFNAEKGQAAPPTYAFRTEEGGPVVGYAAVSFRNAEHPDDRSATRAKYLMVYVVGVNRPYQGRRNPVAPDETYAASIFGVIQGFVASKAGCVGVCLWVRSTNARAIHFYEKAGFVADPSGPVERDSGAPHLTMRKLRG